VPRTSYIFEFVLIGILDRGNVTVKSFIFEVQILDLVNDLAQFGCNFFFTIGNAVQLQNLLVVVLVDALLIFSDEVQLGVEKVDRSLEAVPGVLCCRAFDLLAHLYDHFYMPAAFFDIFIFVEEGDIAAATATRVPGDYVVDFANDVIQLDCDSVYFLFPLEGVEFGFEDLQLFARFYS